MTDETRENLTGYSDSALTQMVFNVEPLYVMRHTGLIMEAVEDMYLYTDAQMENFVESLAEDWEECLDDEDEEE